MRNAYIHHHPDASAFPAERRRVLQKTAIWIIVTAISVVAMVYAMGVAVASDGTTAELFLISNSTNQITAREVKEAFTGNRVFVGTTKLVPVDNASAQTGFLSIVIGMQAARYNTVWTSKSYREGMIPPVVKPDDSDVLDFVRKTPGAIGYVRLKPTGVNIVRRY